MASPAPSRPTPREPDRRKCQRSPTMPQPQLAHPPGEPPDPSFLSSSRWFPPIRCHRAIIQLPDLGLNAVRVEDEGDLQDWFGGRRNFAPSEDVLGLGSCQK